MKRPDTHISPKLGECQPSPSMAVNRLNETVWALRSCLSHPGQREIAFPKAALHSSTPRAHQDRWRPFPLAQSNTLLETAPRGECTFREEQIGLWGSPSSNTPQKLPRQGGDLMHPFLVSSPESHSLQRPSGCESSEFIVCPLRRVHSMSLVSCLAMDVRGGFAGLGSGISASKEEQGGKRLRDESGAAAGKAPSIQY